MPGPQTPTGLVLTAEKGNLPIFYEKKLASGGIICYNKSAWPEAVTQNHTPGDRCRRCRRCGAVAG